MLSVYEKHNEELIAELYEELNIENPYEIKEDNIVSE